MAKRVSGFLIWCALVIALFASPLVSLLRDSLRDGYTSHVALIPLISGYLAWSKRNLIFQTTTYSWRRATQIAAVAILPVTSEMLLTAHQAQPALFSSLAVSSVLLLIVAGFTAFFGTTALRKAVFPLCLLILMLPIPNRISDNIIHLLQSGSATLSASFFSALGVPVLRDGFILMVPGATIEVAKECSGINSSVALLIITLLIAYETLYTTWARVLLVLVVVPLSLLKNAIRIVTLTMLAIRVDPGFLTGKLHHQGGFIFFLIALTLLYPFWMFLQRAEKRLQPVKSPKAPEIAALPLASPERSGE